MRPPNLSVAMPLKSLCRPGYFGEPRHKGTFATVLTVRNLSVGEQRISILTFSRTRSEYSCGAVITVVVIPKYNVL